MHRIFIATVVTVSIVVTAFSASSAVAGEKEVSRFLAGVAGLAILGAILHDQNKKNKTHSYSTHNSYQPLSRPHTTQRQIVKPRPLPHRVSRKLLPGECLRSHKTRRGTVRIFGSKCLNRNFRHVNRLPNQCYREVKTKRGLRRGYGAHCLRNKGYAIARN